MAVASRAVLCDFDGTIVAGDTMASFLLDLARRSPLRGAVVLGWAVAAAIPWLAGADQRRILSVTLWLLTVGRGRRRSVALLREHGRKIADDPRHRPLPIVVERLRAHQRQGDEIWIVSGSCAAWIAPALRRHGVPYARIVGSRLCYFAGGLIMRERCVGAVKAKRVEAAAAGRAMLWTHGYGNERGDLPMLALARQRWMIRPSKSG